MALAVSSCQSANQSIAGITTTATAVAAADLVRRANFLELVAVGVIELLGASGDMRAGAGCNRSSGRRGRRRRNTTAAVAVVIVVAAVDGRSSAASSEKQA
jgi:uncharacterized protein involved in response to NO